MTNTDQITAAVHRYIDLVAHGKVDDIVELFADDATVEDPVGGERHVGRAGLQRFYSAIDGVQGDAELLTSRVCGNEAAFLVRWKMTSMGVQIEAIDVMQFDGDAKITSLKAYWTDADATPLS